MTLDEIIAQSDALLHNPDAEPSTTDVVRLVNELARWLSESSVHRAELIRLHRAAAEAASQPGPRIT